MLQRKTLIWLGLIVLGVPLALVLTNDISTIIDNFTLVASGLLILSLTVTGRRLKRGLKKRMESGLGRAVEDYELTSITAWMRIPDQAARASREAEKYDFND
jgi:hypothetical protein